MGEIRIERNDNVLFVLQREQEQILELDQEPINWDNGALEIVRNKKYHGIITEFTDALEFEKEARDFILDTYTLGGINANLYLLKFEVGLVDDYKTLTGQTAESGVKWELVYRGIGDFLTMKEKSNKISLNFNSDELEQLLKSHESDAFEIERMSSIDAGLSNTAYGESKEDLSDIQFNEVSLRKRDYDNTGIHSNTFNTPPEELTDAGFLTRFKYGHLDRITMPVEFGNKGFKRHVECVNHMFDTSDGFAWESNMFYTDLDVTERNIVSSLKIKMNIKATFTLADGQPLNGSVFFRIQQHEFDPRYGYKMPDSPAGIFGTPGGRVADWEMFNIGLPGENVFPIEINETITIPMGMPYNYAYSMGFVIDAWDEDDNYPNFDVTYQVENWDVELTEVSSYTQESDEKVKFSFVNEVASRLMEIITGKRKKFYSKLFGRKFIQLPPSSGQITQYQDYSLYETGEHGFVGLIHGLSVRRFTKDSHDLYKSLSISMKDLITSLQANFNIGVGIEKRDGEDVLRFEDLKYFYQERVVVVLPTQVNEVTREVEDSLFFSACEFGCAKGGDYEDEVGLDEPNVLSKFTTPLRKTEKKYINISKIRSDDYGREIIRRKPAYLNPKEDMQGDNDIWYLDLIQNPDVTFPAYNQKVWQDVLQGEPTGISSPDTYQSWKFTPKRSFKRHGWSLRTGMDVAKLQEKLFILSEARSNINLATQYIGESFLLIESAPEVVKNLERPRFLPEIIKFKHPKSAELRRLITGTTPVMINGELEEVPNWYFKFQWINERGEVETGYLRSYKEKTEQFEFIKANENLIF